MHPEKVKGDMLYWIDAHGKGSTYVPFSLRDWDDMGAGKARL